MIKEVLLRALAARFPDRGLRAGESPDPVAIFPAAHPDVGDVMVWDDGDEVTLAIGTSTHGGVGGWRRLGAQSGQVVLVPGQNEGEVRSYLWSGPLQRE